MSIQKYFEKRDFEQTTEPKSDSKKTNKKLIFAIQRHHASHLHYDFRLEMEGVLKSWAVPKGPSLNPKDKRLAMMVEDHPYDYKDFEGEIPKGNYGAGTVTIFDKGNYQSLATTRKDDEKTLLEGLKNGNLKINLKGEILKGEFALVRLKNGEQNAWLLIKHNDEFAVNTKFDIEDLVSSEIKKAGKDFKKKKTAPKKKPISEAIIEENSYSPMLATLEKHIFDDKDWIYERKWDGYRILAHLNESVKLYTRNGKDYTDKYDIIVEQLKKIKENAVLDGELIVFDKVGKESFQLLQDFGQHKNSDLNFYVFDLLQLNGYDISYLPLLQRKELLKQLLKSYQLKNIFYNDHTVEKGKQLYEKAKQHKWEGIIAKKAIDEYFIGKRSNSWLKFKFIDTEDVIVCGFTKPTGSRKYFGALVFGLMSDDKKLHYIGNCGSGFKDNDLKNIHQILSAKIIKTKPFQEKAAQESSITWVKPELICEVKFSEWTKDKHLRHPVFIGLRLDKEINNDVISAKDDSLEEVLTPDEDQKEIKIDGKSVKLTNLNKLYWPKEKITKASLINYYHHTASFILPYLKDKPLSLNRHPNGITEAGFYQKDVNTDQIPKWTKTTKVFSESTNKEIDYLICNNAATLVFMANLGCIELNPWLSSYKKPENPEFMVIDLDPDDNSFKEVVAVALSVKAVFDSLGIVSFVKTSGSSGIHIYVYVGAVYDYEFIKVFAQFIAQKVHELNTYNTSIERSPSKRKGKIYIDYLQNRRGQTIAAPYSVRPKPGATVSYPLSWDELNDKLDMNDYHINNVPKLLLERENPWNSIFEKKQNLKKALYNLKNKN
ncbi:DNA ligase D [Pedobacter alpinus]|uniref:DNA ligase (ATP) n=1 Tax=Pedobacter alpinus TaxID=1590643 RepID=A0ABW5TRU6_9SPHI